MKMHALRAGCRSRFSGGNTMRVLYGVQATGNGHITRARVMAPALRAAGIEVDFLFSGRAPDKLFNMEPFGEYQCRRGMSFVFKQGRVCKWGTLRSNSLVELMADIRALDLCEYDLVISDFEPITAWAAKRQRKVCVGLSHQYALRYPLPGPRIRTVMGLLTRLFAPASHAVGLHWHHFNAPILPPLIEPPMFTGSDDATHYLVYLPFESRQQVQQWLQPLSDCRFYVYSDVHELRAEGNIVWCPFSRSAFLRDLARCSGVIANCGFGLGSEVLQMGKRLLVKPLAGQPEQRSNAAVLQALGLATIFEDLSVTQFRRWCQVEPPAAIIYPDVASALARWIRTGCQESQQSLADRLWCEVRECGNDNVM